MPKLKFEHKITAVYTIIGGIWILFSDKILYFFIQNIHLLSKIQTYKGWFYVIITAILFFLFLKRHLVKLRNTEQKLKEKNDEYYSLYEEHKTQNKDLIIAKEKSIESEKKLLGIYNTVGDVVFQLIVEAGNKYRFTSVNDEFVRVTGLKKDQIIGVLINDIIPEPSLKMVLNNYQKAIKERKVVRWEEVSEYPTGELTGDVSIAPLFDTNGICTHLVGAVHDITERKKIEQLLKQKSDEIGTQNEEYEQINEELQQTISELEITKEKAEENEEKIRSSTIVLSKAQSIGKIGSWKWFIQDKKLEWSDEMYNIFGISKDEFKGNLIDVSQQATHPEDRDKVSAINQAVIEEKKLLPLEYRIILPDKQEKTIWAETGELIVDEDSKPRVLTGIIQDITKRKKAEREILRINRVLKILSSCNQELVYSFEEYEFLKKICQHIVEQGDYRFAWIGYAEHDNIKTVRPVAQWGYEEGYLETLNISWADNVQGQGPTGTSLRTGNPVVARNLLNDPNFAPWREAAIKRNYASSIAIPFFINKNVYGSLNIYAVEPDAFDEKEIKLFNELTDYISHGILSLHTDEQRKKAEAKLIESEAKFKLLFNSANDAVFLVDMNEKFIEVNDEAVKRYGYSKKEFLNMGPNDLSPPGFEIQTKKEIETVQKSEKRLFRYKHQKADGTVFPVEISTRKIIYHNETLFLILVHDISEVEKNQQKILNASILAEEKERSRIAKELHDGVSPLLSTINLFVQAIKKTKEQKQKLAFYDRIKIVLKEAIKTVTEISNNLSPHVLFNFGLNTAIEKFIENLSEISNINIEFNSDLDVQLNDKYKLSLYRVTTELLNNTIKYANATEVIISITKKKNLEYAYKDNGKGFDVKKVISSKKRMGLFNIINRIESLNGNVTISSGKGKGINVLVNLPMD